MVEGESNSTLCNKDLTQSARISFTGSRLFPALRHITTPILVFWLGLAWVSTINSLLWSATGQWYATSLAWRLGPWSRFPIPFDSSVFRLAGIGLEGGFLDWAPSLAAAFFVAAIFLSAMHYGLFSLVFAVYSRCGWPPYLKDVRSRVSRIQLWKKCLLRGWWVFPVFGCLDQFWSWFCWGQMYAQCGNLSSDGLFGFMLLMLAVFAYLRTIARVQISTVLAEIREDERRCDRCSYLLRGLTQPICPECGSIIRSDVPPRFSLQRKSSPLRRRVGRLAWCSVVIAVVSLPIWEPAINVVLSNWVAARLPGSGWIAANLPNFIGRRFSWADTGMYPLRLGTFGILRNDDNQVLVLYSPGRKGQPSSLVWWQWKVWHDWSEDPSLQSNEKKKAPSQTTVTFGEDSKTITWGGFQNQRWAWVPLPGPDWHFDVIPEDEAPLELRQLALEATSKPSTR